MLLTLLLPRGLAGSLGARRPHCGGLGIPACEGTSSSPVSSVLGELSGVSVQLPPRVSQSVTTREDGH